MEVRNPEMLRYVRSELRPARVASLASGVVGGALFLALICYSSNRNSAGHLYTLAFWQNLHGALFVATAAILIFWTLINSSQAVVGERTSRTFDFWRTTRLTPATLTFGKLFGPSLSAWLQYLGALPFLLITAAFAGFSITAVLASYLLLALFTIALDCVALCCSMRAHDGRRATLIVFLLLLPVFPNLFTLGGRVTFGAQGLLASAWGAIIPTPIIMGWYGGSNLHASLFNQAVPSWLVSVIFCALVIFWSISALLRSVKLEPEQRSLFSPAQAVGVAASILLFSYAAFQAPNLDNPGNYPHWLLAPLLGSGVVTGFFCVYFAVIASLLSRDRLRHLLRTESSKQVVQRIVWPWIATGALALIAALLSFIAYRHALEEIGIPWSTIFAIYLSMIAYAVRDGMFLQWLISQRVKVPVVKGVVLLGIYYVTSVFFAIAVAGPAMASVARWLLPFLDFQNFERTSIALALATLIPPLATAALLARGVLNKMRPQKARAQVPASVAA